MNFLMNYIKGIAIGAGAILPGISSGVFCVIFGLYDKLIDSILGFFHNCKSNFLFLLPIFLGAFTGILFLSNILLFLFNQYPIPSYFSFIGLILGSLPALFKQAHNTKHFRLSYLIYLFFSLSITIVLILVEKHVSYSICNTSFGCLVLCGFFMSAGVVIPGVSSTAILMCLGIYSIYLSAVSNLTIAILFPMGIGLILGGLLFMKLIQYFLKHHYVPTYYAIIGFVIGSILMIYPGFSFDIPHILGLCCCAIGFFFANFIET